MPDFTPQTRVFHRGTEEYEKHAYQYGSSSHEDGSMAPAVIIYPKSVQDIQKAVKYANENGIGIAVRTGGHQYSGKFISLKSTHCNTEPCWREVEHRYTVAQINIHPPLKRY